MSVILITGAMGQLGNELKIAAKKHFGNDFIFTDFDTLDITDGDLLHDFIKRRKPDWIINCAAYNFVDKAESEHEKAHMINGLAVRNIISVIRDSPCRLIHISTDYVFDGKSSVPYRESDKPNPLSVYGNSKLEGERFALVHPHSLVIRTSWLYSSYGHNFVKTILRLAAGDDQLKVVDDQVGSPTYAADLAHSILDIIAGVNSHQIAFNAGIYHFSNEGSCSWYEFATAILEEAHINKSITPVKMAQYGAVAVRPAYSVLNKSKITDNYRLAIPHWRTSLSKCMKLLVKE
ncbi:MAG TPA: dTDP-4-dehydrorhamnose reductase [Bacteroidales bacterium]|nr:dTDP-4-dehydrorhamnose reductase [Bacteroidales bacterium]